MKPIDAVRAHRQLMKRWQQDGIRPTFDEKQAILDTAPKGDAQIDILLAEIDAIKASLLEILAECAQPTDPTEQLTRIERLARSHLP